MMTLNRYLLVGKDHAPWLVTLAKLEFKWVIRGSVLFSAVINIGHGWQYQAVEGLAASQIGLFGSAYNQANGYSYSDYPQANQATSYLIFSIVYFCINVAVFFVMNTGLEVKIVRRMQKELREKRERLAKMNAIKPAITSCLIAEDNKCQTDLEDKKREEDDGKKERKVITMVVVNGVLNFVFRTPDILFWLEHTSFYNIFHPYQHHFGRFGNTDIVPGVLSFISDFGYLTYILTFSTNFIIFYKFNKNFNEAVVFFWSSKSNKIT
jgi:hypothetical protein